uniref:Uncharacterized protein n=1 Tax=Acrobeloides nanus TaxID=290746 RepID=A0A914C809_9BILA
MIFLILGQENDYEVVRNYTGTIWEQYKMDLDKFVLFGTSMNTNDESTNSTKFTHVWLINIHGEGVHI